jgi:hypothetical protein
MEQDALLAQAREIGSWDARAIEVPGPEEPDLSTEGNGNIFLRVATVFRPPYWPFGTA